MNPPRGFVLKDVPNHGTLVIVSSDSRNRVVPSVLVCQVNQAIQLPTTSTIIELGSAEPVLGYVICDFIFPVHTNDLLAGTTLGRLSQEAMRAIDAGLVDALGLI